MLITLYEHESLPFDWTDQHLRLIDRLRSNVGAEVLRASALRGRRVIQATQYVGVVRLGETTFQILPKIYRGGVHVGAEAQAREATANLLHLLAYTGTVTLRESDVADLLRNESDWFEILTALFATHLTQEWRRSAPRRYQAVEAEVTALKGRWRTSDQARRPDRKHIFSVTYDEFTVDNMLNRVFRFVVERLWKLTRSTRNQRLLGDLRQWMDEVTLLPSVTVTDAAPHHIDRMTTRYAPLLNLARLFLDHGVLQLAAGLQHSFAFVFDMNQLFERLVAIFLTRHRTQLLVGDLQSAEIVVQARGMVRYLARSDGRQVLGLNPDILLKHEKSVPLLIDTKYKRLNVADPLLGISQSDFYQMYAYAQRYQCPHVVLLFPQTADIATPVRRNFVLEETPNWIISAATLDIRYNLTAIAAQKLLAAELRLILTQE